MPDLTALRLSVILMACQAVVVATAAAAAMAQPEINPRARALEEFGNRINRYLILQQKLARTVTPLPPDATPEQARRHREALAAAIRRARHDSKPGHIFTPPVVPQFRTIIRRDLRSRDVRDAMAALQEVPRMSVHVNATWPPGAPRPTVPPRLLASLYPLPAGLEYGFVGRHLVLLDTRAALMVDFITDVVPSVGKR